MPTITVAYDVNQTVYAVSLNDGVREGIVRSSTVEINATSTTITYDIAYTLPTIGCSGSSTEVEQDDLFADIDTALAEYKTRIQG